MNEDIKKFKVLVRKCKIVEARIAKDRDKMKEYGDELENIIYSIEVGSEEFNNGIRSIQNGIDEISQYL